MLTDVYLSYWARWNKNRLAQWLTFQSLLSILIISSILSLSGLRYSSRAAQFDNIRWELNTCSARRYSVDSPLEFLLSSQQLCFSEGPNAFVLLGYNKNYLYRYIYSYYLLDNMVHLKKKRWGKWTLHYGSVEATLVRCASPTSISHLRMNGGLSQSY